MELDAAEEELVGLQYARHHNLCKDYTAELLPLADIGLPDGTIDLDNQDLGGPSLASIINALRVLTKERLTVSRDTALLLKAVHSLQEAPTETNVATNRRAWRRSLERELPVLSSDHELDLLKFGDTKLPDFRNLRLPSELIEDENDEGFQWPLKYLNYPAQCDNQVRAEKLTVSRQVLVHLQHAIRDDYMPEDHETARQLELDNKPVCMKFD